MAHATPPSVLAIVQAGGKGSRMDVLTRERAKPALPFAGGLRLIDFALSSLAHSAISDVWVSVQYQAGSLDTHLAGGRPWDLDRTRGGLRRMVPEQGAGAPTQTGFAQGNADNLYRLADQVSVHAPDLLVVSSADHVFRMDLRPVIAEHLETGAECTVCTSDVSPAEAANNTVVLSDGSGWVEKVLDKPDDPPGTTVATELFVYDCAVLLAELERLRRQVHDPTEGEDTGLGDFADHLLPALVDRGRVRMHPVPGYWRDVGRPEAYLAAHRDVLAGRTDLFDDPAWPILGQPPTGPPALVAKGAVVADSMLSTGCEVRGEVVRSVLGPGVRVEAGARVVDSVLFADVQVQEGARVATSVVDERVSVGRDAVVGREPAGTGLQAEDITLVGADSLVERGAAVAAGSRMEPGSRT